MERGCMFLSTGKCFADTWNIFIQLLKSVNKAGYHYLVPIYVCELNVCNGVILRFQYVNETLDIRLFDVKLWPLSGLYYFNIF